jgi:hypothetical protein
MDMNKATSLKAMAAAVFAATFAVSAYAGEATMKKGEPSSVDESRPDMTGKDAKGKAGVPTMPSKGPSSVDESKTGQAGKGPAKGVSKDDNRMANPKTPSSVSESKPDTARDDSAAKKYGKSKDKDGAPR